MSYFLKRAAAERAWDIDAAQRAAIQLEQLTVHGILGVGAFGRVKLVTHEPRGAAARGAAAAAEGGAASGSGGGGDGGGSGAPAYALKCISKGQARA